MLILGQLRAFLCKSIYINYKIKRVEVKAMNNDEIKIKKKGDSTYDIYKIALAIKNSTYDDDMECSLVNENIIDDCQHCGLRFICNGINNLSDEFVSKTTKTVQHFSV